jgi:hypothetical protein
MESAAARRMAMAKLPTTFQEALKSGYHIEKETSQETGKGKRAGTVHLKNGSRPGLSVRYEADRRGYRFGKPEVRV